MHISSLAVRQLFVFLCLPVCCHKTPFSVYPPTIIRSTFLNLCSPCSFFLRQFCSLCESIKTFSHCCQEKENLFSFSFLFLSGSLLLCSAAPLPPLLCWLYFHFSLLPPPLLHPSVFPLENRGHCTNDYSDPGRHGNAAM